jgi:hypothetical protein
MNRVPRAGAPALDGGKLLHCIFEDYFQLGTPLLDAANAQVLRFRQAMSDMTESSELKTAEEAVTIVTDLAEALPLWKEAFKWDEMLECEKPFAIVLPQYADDIEWLGRPDYMGLSGGRIWHRQNRGLASGMNFGTYIELAKRNRHEHLYAEYAMREYKHLGLRYGGTEWNLVRKLKFRTNVGKKNEKVKTAAEMFSTLRSSINLRTGLHRSVMLSAVYHVREMERVRREWLDSNIVPAPNEKMNGGYGGNSLDPFFLVLTGQAKLSDDTLFKDREDMYANA